MALSDWLETVPVTLDEFVQSREYLRNPPLSPLQYDAVIHAERVYFPDCYPQLARARSGRFAATAEQRAYWAQDIRMVNFLTLEWGKGGGKDHTCRVISMRVAYLLLCLAEPQDYFGFAPQDSIHLLNVASSAPQANTAFFAPMRKAVTRRGCWLQPRAEPMVGEVRYDKSIIALSGHSDAETQEGLNLILAVADEVDAFKREEELEVHRASAARESTKSAEAILKMMRTSVRTRFPVTGKNVRISYPRYQGSMIQTLIADGVKDNKRRGRESKHYVSGPHPTWVVNPLRRKEDFADDYDEDPVLARARYECDPAPAIHPYFSNEIAITSCLVEHEQAPLAVTYRPATRLVIHPDGERNTVISWSTEYDFGASLVPMRGAVYAMHADLAVTQDRAGVAMAHVVRWDDEEVIGKDSEGGDVRMMEQRPFVKVDFVIAYEADASADPAREIQIGWARELCLELRRRGFNVRFFSFDQFQSTESMQALEKQGIEVQKRSTDTSTEPYRGLRDLFNQARIEMPADPVLLTELRRLNRMSNGKINHPPGGSKDMSDAVACAVRGAVEMGGQEDGGVAYVADATFDRGGFLDLPEGFEPPSAVHEAGFGAVEVLHLPISFASQEAGFGAWAYEDEVGPAYGEVMSGPPRPD